MWQSKDSVSSTEMLRQYSAIINRLLLFTARRSTSSITRIPNRKIPCISHPTVQNPNPDPSRRLPFTPQPATTTHPSNWRPLHHPHSTQTLSLPLCTAIPSVAPHHRHTPDRLGEPPSANSMILKVFALGALVSYSGVSPSVSVYVPFGEGVMRYVNPPLQAIHRHQNGRPSTRQERSEWDNERCASRRREESSFGWFTVHVCSRASWGSVGYGRHERTQEA
jgi:hypothetical protein